MQDCGGIDLQILGIGVAGHIGFNEPLSALRSRTREKALSPATLQNAPLFPRPEDMPKRGITMGVGTILDSRSCILLATGRHKADIIAKAVEGPITSMVSASALQLHARCRVVVDEKKRRPCCRAATTTAGSSTTSRSGTSSGSLNGEGPTKRPCPRWRSSLSDRSSMISAEADEFRYVFSGTSQLRPQLLQCRRRGWIERSE